MTEQSSESKLTNKSLTTKKILIISTGGTFNCVQTDKGLMPRFQEDELRENLKPVTTECELILENLLNIDSANIKPEHWKLLADCIEKY